MHSRLHAELQGPVVRMSIRISKVVLGRRTLRHIAATGRSSGSSTVVFIRFERAQIIWQNTPSCLP
jgi:hypothetical protein